MLTIDLDSLELDLHVGCGKLVLSRYKVNLACGTLSLKDSVPGSLNPQSILAILTENVTPTAAFNAPVIKGEGKVIADTTLQLIYQIFKHFKFLGFLKRDNLLSIV